MKRAKTQDGMKAVKQAANRWYQLAQLQNEEITRLRLIIIGLEERVKELERSD